MIRIRRVTGTALPADQEQIDQVKNIFRRTYPEVASYAEKIPDMIDHPFRYGYRSILLVSRSGSRKVTGFSLCFHFPEIAGSLLDFVVVDPGIKGGGIGSALYDATREIRYPKAGEPNPVGN